MPAQIEQPTENGFPSYLWCQRSPSIVLTLLLSSIHKLNSLTRSGFLFPPSFSKFDFATTSLTTVLSFSFHCTYHRRIPSFIMRTSVFLAAAASLSTAYAQIKGFNYGATQTDGTIKSQTDFENEFKTAQNLVGTSGFNSARLYTMIVSKPTCTRK
jgi:hypothetical protein